MILYMAHAGIRYLILLAGAAALARAVHGLMTGARYDKAMRVLGGIFAGLIHLQILLGLGLLFARQFYPALIGHVMMMVLAALAAQVVPSVMRRRPEEERTYGPHIVGTLVALGLIVGGILAVPGGMVFGTRGG